MAGVNKAIIIGNLGKDPELRSTNNGTAVCNFTVATSEKYKDTETTEWHSIVAWGRLAELCSEYIHKGSKVYVEGRIQTRSWDQDGEKKYKTEIVANNVQFMDGKSSVLPGHGPQDKPSADDDIPF